MVNWIFCEALGFLTFTWGTWKSFKLLKEGQVDFDMLKIWSILALLHLFEDYFEFLVSWVPFYYLAKTLLLVFIILAEKTTLQLVFTGAVIPCMEWTHRLLNQLDIQNSRQVLEFATALPMLAMMVLFPFHHSGSQRSKNTAALRRGSTASKDPPQGLRQSGGPRSSTPLRMRNSARRLQSRLNVSKKAEQSKLSAVQTSRAASTSLRLGALAQAHHLQYQVGSPEAERSPRSRENTGRKLVSEAYEKYPVPADSEGETPTKKKSFRESALNFVRKSLTGDENIRVRDHLWDLGTPLPPSTLPRRGSMTLMTSQLAALPEAKEGPAAKSPPPAEGKTASNTYAETLGKLGLDKTKAKKKPVTGTSEKWKGTIAAKNHRRQESTSAKPEKKEVNNPEHISPIPQDKNRTNPKKNAVASSETEKKAIKSSRYGPQKKQGSNPEQRMSTSPTPQHKKVAKLEKKAVGSRKSGQPKAKVTPDPKIKRDVKPPKKEFTRSGYGQSRTKITPSPRTKPKKKEEPAEDEPRKQANNSKESSEQMTIPRRRRRRDSQSEHETDSTKAETSFTQKTIDLLSKGQKESFTQEKRTRGAKAMEEKTPTRLQSEEKYQIAENKSQSNTTPQQKRRKSQSSPRKAAARKLLAVINDSETNKGKQSKASPKGAQAKIMDRHSEEASKGEDQTLKQRSNSTDSTRSHRYSLRSGTK